MSAGPPATTGTTTSLVSQAASMRVWVCSPTVTTIRLSAPPLRIRTRIVAASASETSSSLTCAPCTQFVSGSTKVFRSMNST